MNFQITSGMTNLGNKRPATSPAEKEKEQGMKGKSYAAAVDIHQEME